MKFGIREIANVVFRAKAEQKIGNVTFKKGQPVFYLDTAKTSSMEGAATTVYATGGRGNVRLLAWEGQRTLTFTVEDALLSPVSFAMLSGAGVVKGTGSKKIHFHQTTSQMTDTNGKIDLTDALAADDDICSTAPFFVMEIDKTGDLTGKLFDGYTVGNDNKSLVFSATANTTANDVQEKTVFIDYYVLKDDNKATELQIDMEHFGGYYYVEADTLFRNQNDGQDYPANLTFPNVKIQSNFTFSMAATGDPSTFTFTMDAMPGYTYFDKRKKVLCAIQIADDNKDIVATRDTVFPHVSGETFEESGVDSSPNVGKPATQG